MNTPSRPAWEYTDARGARHIGYVETFTDHGGTDVTYIMRDSTTGEVTCLSGSLLKAARTLGKTVPIWEECGPRMMPGQEPYTPEEMTRLQNLVSDAAKGDPGEADEGGI